jgi:MFS family permease
VVVAAVLDSPVLLFVSLFVYGAGSATNLQARYAGADLADPGHRARAISTVLVATTLGGVVGPLLAAPTGHLAHMVGVPHLAGPFILASASYVAAAVVLATRLRPDPLLHARAVAAEEAEEAAAAAARPGGPVPPAPAQVGHGILLGAVVMVLTQAVMVAIMTMTPVHMHDHGHGTGAAGLVIAVHVAAMYLPSPLTGRLVDRVGRTTMALASGGTLLAAGLLAASAPDDSVVLLALALALLGLGWNFGLVSGSAIITDAAPLETRARTQGLVDVSIAMSGAGGGLASGIVVDVAGFSTLSLAGGLLALAIVPAIAAGARSRGPLARA